MFELAKNLLKIRQFKMEKGELSLLQQPVLITTIDFHVSLLKRLEKIGKENEIYYSAKDAGENWFRNMHKEFKIEAIEKLFRWGMDLFNLAGYGECSNLKMDLEKHHVSMEMKNSAIAKTYGESEHPVDHMIRGHGAGAQSYFFGRDINVVETKCEAMGDNCCEFVCKPKEEWDLTDPFVKQQLQIQE